MGRRTARVFGFNVKSAAGPIAKTRDPDEARLTSEIRLPTIRWPDPSDFPVHQELDIPLGALDRTLDDAFDAEAVLARGGYDGIDRGSALAFVSNDSTLSDFAFANFELRLDQRNKLSAKERGHGR